jgi:hypothetical protein
MKHMFSQSPWWLSTPGSVQGLGFTPGPVRLRVVGAPMPPEEVPSAPPPQAAAFQKPIPLGSKGSCPV